MCSMHTNYGRSEEESEESEESDEAQEMHAPCRCGVAVYLGNSTVLKVVLYLR
jgi:hypothetical protein